MVLEDGEDGWIFFLQWKVSHFTLEFAILLIVFRGVERARTGEFILEPSFSFQVYLDNRENNGIYVTYAVVKHWTTQ